MKPFKFFDHLKTEWNQSRCMYFILHLFWAVMEHDLVGFIKSIIVILTSVMPWNDERFLALKLRKCNLCQRSLKNIIFFSSLPSSSFMDKKGAFFLHRTSGPLRLFSFFHKAAQFVFAVSLPVFIAVELPKLLQKTIIQQITDVKLFAYPPKQHDHFSTDGINTTFHQIIQHHNVLHLEAVSNAEQPVHNDSYEDICPLLFHRHVSSRFRKEIWMFL